MGRTVNRQKEKKKEKIRAKINNADNSDVIVIPAKPIEAVENDTSIRRVAAYCRVSTDEETQTTSFELQKATYIEMIAQHPGWELAGIYADEGISGTSFNHRLGMQQMIEDCKAGKIDMIITKSIARFARNIVDCLSTIEMLKNLPHPVGIQFETEHLYTLDERSRMVLALLSSVAEEESGSKSRIMNWSIENRFSKGLFLTPPLYGYDQDPETDQLVINPEEAKIVRLCFFLYLSGFTFRSIADTLTGLGVQTFTGKTVWSGSTIRHMLTNERHYGAVLAHKTFTPNFLNHKAKKNNGERKQYLREEDHEAIVSKKVFEAVNRKIVMDKVKQDGAPLPSLDIVDDGILRGYVSVNRRWEGFTEKDFLEASQSVSADAAPTPVRPDVFSIDDYEIVSSRLFSYMDRPVMTVKDGTVRFNTLCMKKFHDVEHVEILMNSVEKKIAVRPCGSESPYAFRWGKFKDTKWRTFRRRCRGLTEPLFGLMQWEEGNTYRIAGQYFEEGESEMLVFDLEDPEIIKAEQKAEPAETHTDPADGENDSRRKPEENTDIEGSSGEYEPEGHLISFGGPALFGMAGTVVFERQHYMGNWEIMRPAKFYKYCTEITEEELQQIRDEASSLLTELKGA